MDFVGATYQNRLRNSLFIFSTFYFGINLKCHRNRSNSSWEWIGNLVFIVLHRISRGQILTTEWISTKRTIIHRVSVKLFEFAIIFEIIECINRGEFPNNSNSKQQWWHWRFSSFLTSAHAASTTNCCDSFYVTKMFRILLSKSKLVLFGSTVPVAMTTTPTTSSIKHSASDGMETSKASETYVIVQVESGWDRIRKIFKST